MEIFILDNGNGIIYDKDGNEIYKGEFVNDKKEGKGIYYFDHDGENEFYYDGEFKNDLANGEGMIYSNKQKRRIFEGYFINGSMEGMGKVYYSNGDFEICEFKNNEPIGKKIRYIQDIAITNFFDKVEKGIKNKCILF